MPAKKAKQQSKASSPHLVSWDQALDSLWEALCEMLDKDDQIPERPESQEEYLEMRSSLMDICEAFGAKIAFQTKRTMLAKLMSTLDAHAGYAEEVEKRVASDGKEYSEIEFCRFFGAVDYPALWEAANPNKEKPPTPKPEPEPKKLPDAPPDTVWAEKAGRRDKRCAADGNLYTEAEFLQHYGLEGAERWDAAVLEHTVAKKRSVSPSALPHDDEWS